MVKQLRRYGYTSVHHARYDVVEIPWNLVVSALKQSLAIDDAIWGKAVSDLQRALSILSRISADLP